MNHKAAHSHFKKIDPIMHALAKHTTLGPHRRKKGSRFQALVQSILSQQLSTKVADVIIKRFINLYKPKRFPTPQDILSTEDKRLRDLGISYSKISYLKNLSEYITSKKLRLQSVHKLENEALIEHLIQVKGIGRWTAEMFMMFMLERPDVFSHGDLGLKNAIIKLYKLKNPTAERIEQISKKWSPYRTLASRYLWASLDNE